MGSRIDCIKGNSRSKDGILIEGHSYIAKLAVYDKDVDRTYCFDVCMNCDKASAGWVEGKDADTIKLYDQYQEVGGPASDDPDVFRGMNFPTE